MKVKSDFSAFLIFGIIVFCFGMWFIQMPKIYDLAIYGFWGGVLHGSLVLASLVMWLTTKAAYGADYNNFSFYAQVNNGMGYILGYMFGFLFMAIATVSVILWVLRRKKSKRKEDIQLLEKLKNRHRHIEIKMETDPDLELIIEEASISDRIFELQRELKK